MGLLKTDYKNDVLDLAVNPDRKFQPVDNGDGTFSYNDVTTYSQVGDAFGANDINATNLAINNILGDCATVEETTTASKAYDIGDYLVMDGYFYKVTAAISAGNTLVVGGNIEQTNVGAEISTLNKDLLNKTETISGCTSTVGAVSTCEMYTIGKIAFLNADINPVTNRSASDFLVLPSNLWSKIKHPATSPYPLLIKIYIPSTGSMFDGYVTNGIFRIVTGQTLPSSQWPRVLIQAILPLL